MRRERLHRFGMGRRGDNRIDNHRRSGRWCRDHGTVWYHEGDTVALTLRAHLFNNPAIGRHGLDDRAFHQLLPRVDRSTAGQPFGPGERSAPEPVRRMATGFIVTNRLAVLRPWGAGAGQAKVLRLCAPARDLHLLGLANQTAHLTRLMLAAAMLAVSSFCARQS